MAKRMARIRKLPAQAPKSPLAYGKCDGKKGPLVKWLADQRYRQEDLPSEICTGCISFIWDTKG
jgi:hypothetical protein